MEDRDRCKCGGRVEKLKEIDSSYADGYYERLGIYLCKECFQIYKIHWRLDESSGWYNSIWLKPGEEKGGYSFPLDEYKKVLEELGMTEEDLKIARWSGYVGRMYKLAEEICEKSYKLFSEVKGYAKEDGWLPVSNLLNKSHLSYLLALHFKEDICEVLDSLVFIDAKLREVKKKMRILPEIKGQERECKG